MKKDGALMGTILLCSAGISFGAITYLIDFRLLIAIAFVGLYFIGGLFLPRGKIGMKTRALWKASASDPLLPYLPPYRLSSPKLRAYSGPTVRFTP